MAGGTRLCQHTGKSVCLELYNNKDFSGFIRQLQPVDSINVDCSENQPDPLVNKDNFAARWTGKYQFTAGTYRFVTDTDQGVLLYIDGQKVIDQWTQQNNKQQKIINSARLAYA